MNNSEKAYRELLQSSLERITDEIGLLEAERQSILGTAMNFEKRLEKLKVEQKRLQLEIQRRNTQQETIETGVLSNTTDKLMTRNQIKQQETSTKIKLLCNSYLSYCTATLSFSNTL